MGNTALTCHPPPKETGHSSMDPSLMPTRTCPLSPAALCRLYGKSRCTLTVNDAKDTTSLVLYGAYLEMRQILHWSRRHDMHGSSSTSVKRVCLLSCCRGLDVSEDALVDQLIKFLQTHAQEMQWLVLTGPLL